MAAISREEVAHLAHLARLAVTEEELDTFAGQLDVILQAVARVGEVAAADMPPRAPWVPRPPGAPGAPPARRWGRWPACRSRSRTC